MLYSHNNQPPTSLPERIRLSDGSTKTDSSTYTPDEIADAGYVAVSDPPPYDPTTQTLGWGEINGSYGWIVTQLETPPPISKEIMWNRIRAERDILMREAEWRLSRNNREHYLKMVPTDGPQYVHDHYTYMQALADITKLQEDPFNIVWPTPPYSVDNS